MTQYIPKDAVVAEINRIDKSIGCDRFLSEYEKGCNQGKEEVCDTLRNFLDTLEVKEMEEYEQPEHSCFEYKCGKKPYWNVGDTLAYYEFCSDREGEHILGKVANVRFDDEQSDWIYTFEDGSLYDEESLLEEKIYKKK